VRNCAIFCLYHVSREFHVGTFALFLWVFHRDYTLFKPNEINWFISPTLGVVDGLRNRAFTAFNMDWHPLLFLAFFSAAFASSSMFTIALTSSKVCS